MTRDGGEERLAQIRDRVLHGARLARGDDVLDLCAGDGLLTFGAHARIGGGWVYAVDASVAALEALLRAAHARHVAGIMYLLGAADVIPLPDGSVDACVGRSLLPDVDASPTVGELHRVLRPGGRLSLHEAAGREEGELAATLTAAGFTDVEVEIESAEGPGAWVTACRG